MNKKKYYGYEIVGTIELEHYHYNSRYLRPEYTKETLEYEFSRFGVDVHIGHINKMVKNKETGYKIHQLVKIFIRRSNGAMSVKELFEIFTLMGVDLVGEFTILRIEFSGDKDVDEYVFSDQL